MALDLTNDRETPEAVVLESYKVMRGIAAPSATTPAPIIVEMLFAECILLKDGEGHALTTAHGSPAYRRAKDGKQWAIYLDMTNPAHQSRLITAMADVCANFAAAVHQLDGVTKTSQQLAAIAGQLLQAGLPDDALANACEKVELARRAGAVDMDVRM